MCRAEESVARRKVWGVKAWITEAGSMAALLEKFRLLALSLYVFRSGRLRCVKL